MKARRMNPRSQFSNRPLAMASSTFLVGTDVHRIEVVE